MPISAPRSTGEGGAVARRDYAVGARRERQLGDGVVFLRYKATAIEEAHEVADLLAAPDLLGDYWSNRTIEA